MDEPMMKRRYGRTDPSEPKDGPTSNPDAEELAALRKEKADREKAEREARDKELDDLRAYKAEQENKRPVKAPAPKADKTPEPPKTTEPEVKKGKRGLWWDHSE
jgi:hypothetical protein